MRSWRHPRRRNFRRQHLLLSTARLGEPRVGQVAAFYAHVDPGGQHSGNLGSFACRRGGVDDLLRVACLDVLAGELCENRGGVNAAQALL
jgi:hypothetical protein